GPADDDRLAVQHLQLAPQVAGDPSGTPAELDDVDVVAARLEDVLPGARAQAFVEHMGETPVAADAAVEPVKVVQGFPPVVASPPPARRGRASCRVSRSRR